MEIQAAFFLNPMFFRFCASHCTVKFLHKLLNHHGLVLPVPLRNNETEIGEIAMEQMELKKLQILSAKYELIFWKCSFIADKDI